MNHLLKNIFGTILDAVFPWKCVGCQKLGNVLCSRCRARLVFEKNVQCPFCKETGFFGSVCNTCVNICNLSQVFAVFPYANPVVRNIIHDCKYTYVQKLGNLMGELLFERLFSLSILPPTDDVVVIPIPLHHRRFSERGFNQAEGIACIFSASAQYVMRTDILIRPAFRPSQINVAPQRRLKNVTGVFAVQNADFIHNKKIVLIDDVMTSGSTLREAARVLGECNPKSISAYVFAKG